MPRPSPWIRRLYILAVLALTISGLAQMPIFKRYYVADLPGLGWLADFLLTHRIHYAAAAVFLAVIAYAAVMHLGRWKSAWRITAWGHARNVLVLGIAVTGVLRTLKNLPRVHFGPTTVMLVDWLHLACVILLGLLALAALVARRRKYAPGWERAREAARPGR